MHFKKTARYNKFKKFCSFDNTEKLATNKAEKTDGIRLAMQSSINVRWVRTKVASQYNTKLSSLVQKTYIIGLCSHYV